MNGENGLQVVMFLSGDGRTGEILSITFLPGCPSVFLKNPKKHIKSVTHAPPCTVEKGLEKALLSGTCAVSPGLLVPCLESKRVSVFLLEQI